MSGRHTILTFFLFFAAFSFIAISTPALNDIQAERAIRSYLQEISLYVQRFRDRHNGRMPESLDELRSAISSLQKPPSNFQGEIIFCKPFTDSSRHDTPLIIYFDHEAQSFVRVVYSWNQDVRVVRRGTKEYDRVLERVRSHGQEISKITDDQKPATPRPISFCFLNENGKPIAGKFTLLEYVGDICLSGWYKGKPVGEDGMVRLEDSPEEFIVYFVSDDTFYTRGYTHKDVDFGKETNTLSIQPTGTIVFSLEAYPTSIKKPLVVLHYVKKPDNTYERKGGMGIFPEVGREFEIEGLQSGVYRIELKHDYKDKHIIWEKSDIFVKAKRKTIIPPMRITENNLKARAKYGAELND